MTSFPRSVMTRRCSFYVDDVVFEVCHDQTRFCVVHEDDNVLFKVNHDQAMFLFCAVHVDDNMFSKDKVFSMTK